MSNLKDIQQIQSLITKGKGAGFLTFEEVNKALPVEMNTPEYFEEIIGIFEQLEIAIVDTEKDGKKISAAAENDEEIAEGSLDLSEDEESADYSSRSTDPVRMYLREMGAVPLLDRDGEVVIAKKIEMGEQDVLYALVEVPWPLRNSSTWAKTCAKIASNSRMWLKLLKKMTPVKTR